jgi:hypothetical protein
MASFPSMLDLLPLVQNMPVGLPLTDSRMVKQRRFVDFNDEYYKQYLARHSEIIDQTIDYINQRVKSRFARRCSLSKYNSTWKTGLI